MNEAIIKALVACAAAAKYNTGRGILLALTGEELPVVPDNIAVVRLDDPLKYWEQHEAIPAVQRGRYNALQISHKAQLWIAERYKSRYYRGDRTGAEKVREFHGLFCNLDECPPFVVVQPDSFGYGY